MLPSQQPMLIDYSHAHTVVNATKSCHIAPILRSLHWLWINERIEYKLLSLTYKVLTTTQPPYLHNVISVHCPCSTRSSSVATLAWPPTSFLANVNVLRYVCYMLWAVRLSVVCLSVVCCLWRWCTLLRRLNFSAIFFHHTIAQRLYFPGAKNRWWGTPLSPWNLRSKWPTPFKQRNFDKYRLIAPQPS